MKDIFILVIHFQMSQLFKSATMRIYCIVAAKLDGGGCQLPYTEFEDNNLYGDLSQRAEGAPENFLGIPNFFPEIPENCGEFRKFRESAVIKSILIAYHKLRHNRSGYNFMYVKRGPLVAERRDTVVFGRIMRIMEINI